MTVARYRIPDEPRPSGLIRYAVDPMWPLLALMLGGNGIGLAWFGFNSHALGSATSRREWVYIASSLLGCVLLMLAIRFGVHRGWLEGSMVAYAALAYAALKLSIGYALYTSQSRSAEIINHFGGRLRNGAVGLLLCFIVARSVLDPLALPGLLSVALK